MARDVNTLDSQDEKDYDIGAEFRGISIESELSRILSTMFSNTFTILLYNYERPTLK